MPLHPMAISALTLSLLLLAPTTGCAADGTSPIGTWTAQLRDKDVTSGIIGKTYVITEKQLKIVQRREGRKKESTVSWPMIRKDGAYVIIHEGHELPLKISSIDAKTISLAIDVLAPDVLVRTHD